jgi:hypothetical protein
VAEPDETDIHRLIFLADVAALGGDHDRAASIGALIAINSFTSLRCLGRNVRNVIYSLKKRHGDEDESSSQ